MNKIFYAIYNKEENKFLSIYEDGEGNEYYNVVELSEFSNVGNPLFKSKEDAEFKYKEAINIAGFTMRMNAIPYSREFLMDAEIVPIQISVRFDLITEE